MIQINKGFRKVLLQTSVMSLQKYSTKKLLQCPCMSRSFSASTQDSAQSLTNMFPACFDCFVQVTGSIMKKLPKKSTIEQGPKNVGLMRSTFSLDDCWLFRKAASSKTHQRRPLHVESQSTSISSLGLMFLSNAKRIKKALLKTFEPKSAAFKAS